MVVASCLSVEALEAWVLPGPQREGVLEEGVAHPLAWPAPSLAWVVALGGHGEGREAGQRVASLVALLGEGVSILVEAASCQVGEACQEGLSVEEAFLGDEGACLAHPATGVGASQGGEDTDHMDPDFDGHGTLEEALGALRGVGVAGQAGGVWKVGEGLEAGVEQSQGEEALMLWVEHWVGEALRRWCQVGVGQVVGGAQACLEEEQTCLGGHWVPPQLMMEVEEVQEVGGLTEWVEGEHLQTAGEACRPGTEGSGQPADVQQLCRVAPPCCLS